MHLPRGLSRSLLIAVVVAVTALALAACGNEDTSPTEPSPAATTAPTKLVVGVLPFLDYQPWYVASALGLDKEQGFELEFKTFPLEPNEIRALARGDVQIAQGAIGSLIPQIPQRDDLRIFLSEAQFKGFAFVGRKGEIKTFDEFVAEGMSDQDAQKATVEQFAGKDIVTIKSSFGATIDATLEQAGVKASDVKIINFPDSPAAVVTYLRGTGDIFMGGLPETVKLLKQSGDKYVTVIGAQDMGPAGLWYSNAYVTQAFVDENRDQLVKLAAVWYRTMRYLEEQPDTTYATMVEKLNAQGASGMTVDDAKELIPDFTYFPTVEGAKELTYDPNSTGYWKTLTDYLIVQNEKSKTIPKGSVKADTIIIQEQIFNEMQANQALVDWINSPLK